MSPPLTYKKNERYSSPDGRHVITISKITEARIYFKRQKLHGKEIPDPQLAWIQTDLAEEFFAGFGICIR